MPGGGPEEVHMCRATVGQSTFNHVKSHAKFIRSHATSMNKIKMLWLNLAMMAAAAATATIWLL